MKAKITKGQRIEKLKLGDILPLISSKMAELDLAAVNPAAASPDKPKRKKVYYGVGGLSLLLVLLLVVFMLSTSTAKECEDTTCFIDEANKCKNVFSLDYGEDGELFRYSANDCTFEKIMLFANPDEPAEMRLAVEGKGLRCEYDKGRFNEVWLGTLTFGLEGCEGELKNVIEDLAALSAAIESESKLEAERIAALPQPTRRITDRLEEGKEEIYAGEKLHVVAILSVSISGKENVPSIAELTVDGANYTLKEGESITAASGIKITIDTVFTDGSVSFTLESFD